MTLYDQLVWYIGVSTVASIASVLPLRVLDIHLWRGLLCTFIAHIGALYIVLNVVIPRQRTSAPDQNIVIIIALGVGDNFRIHSIR